MIRCAACAVALGALAAVGPVACETVVERPGVTMVNGAYQRYFESPADEVLQAAAATYQDFGLLLAGSDKSSVVARTKQGATVETVASQSGRLTRARVRVYPGYDETLSTGVLDGIEERLGK